MQISDIVEFEEIINSFRGEYGFLSNFHRCNIIYDDVEWKSSEHLYVAQKAKFSKDREKIRNHSFDGLKEAGRTMPNRDDWDDVKYDAMADALLAKFTQNEYLKEKLLATGDTPIVEGNDWHDNDYGDCRCPKCEKIVGQNNLGQLLMSLRDWLRDNNEKNG